MDPADKLLYDVVFNNLSYLISNKILNLSNSSKAYIDTAIQFFNDLNKSLDSIGSFSAEIDDNNSSYVLFPNLKEVVSSVPNAPANIDEKDVKLLRKYFSGIILEIENLKSNPKVFYESEKSEELKNLAASLSMIHSETCNTHTFETEETFSNGYFLC